MEPLGTPPASRFGYVSVVHENRFVLFGGYDGTTWLNDTHEYDFDTELWRTVEVCLSVSSFVKKKGDIYLLFTVCVRCLVSFSTSSSPFPPLSNRQKVRFRLYGHVHRGVKRGTKYSCSEVMTVLDA